MTKVENALREAATMLLEPEPNVGGAVACLQEALAALPATDHRRRLPDERPSITHHMAIGSYDGYITVGLYDDGKPGEVFVKMSKEGATLAGLIDAFAIMFSIALQYGAPLKVITDKLSGMRFDPSGFTPHPGIEYAKSPVDYIARWLAEKFLPAEERPEPTKPLVSVPPPAGAVTGSDGPPCARCGHLMMRAGSNNCFVCPNCSATEGSCGG